MANRPGRPPLSRNDPSTDVSVKMPASLYDRLYKRAADSRVSVPEVIRRAVARDLEIQNS